MKKANFKPLALFSIFVLSAGSFSSGWTSSIKDDIEDFVDSAKEKVKDAFDDAEHAVKKGIKKLGEDKEAVQEYLDNYDWKGIIQDEASSGGVTLKHLKLNDHSRVTTAHPEEPVQANVVCDLDREQCHALKFYRVVLGIKGEGPQTTIGNEFGIVAGESLENFELIAPKEPGVYQIRFRLVESFRGSEALKGWEDEKGNEPDASTTIGILVVKK